MKYDALSLDLNEALLSYCVGSAMNCADMILDSVDVANLAEVNLSDMVESGVDFPKFT